MGKYFKTYILNHKTGFSILVICVLATVLVGIPAPLITKYLFDSVLIGGNYSLVVPLASLFLLVTAIQLIIGRLYAWIVSRYSQDFINELRVRLVSLFLDAKTSDGVSAGNLMVIINSDIPSLAQLNIGIVTTILQSLFSLIGYSTMLFFLNAKLAIISLAIFPIYYIWIKHVSKKMQELTRSSQLINEELLSSVEQIERNAETIKVYGYVTEKKMRFASIANRIGDFVKKYAMYSNFVGSVSSSITALAGFIPLVLGVYFIGSNEMTIGDLISFNSYCGMLFSPISAFIELSTKRKVRVVHEERIESYEETIENFPDSSSLKKLHTPVAEIAIENYSLMSRGRELLTIKKMFLKKGQHTLVCGGNGVGKSLFLKSLSGLYDDYSGEITYGGEPRRALEAKSINTNIMYVSSKQNFVLDTMKQEVFDTCIVSEETIEKVAEEMGLVELVKMLPNGFETPVEELDKKLNTGTIQKLRILRALSRNPSFLFLDEVLSNIEIHQCRSVLSTIRSSFPHLGVIVVEHHLDVPDCFDETLVISDGVISKSC